MISEFYEKIITNTTNSTIIFFLLRNSYGDKLTRQVNHNKLSEKDLILIYCETVNTNQ